MTELFDEWCENNSVSASLREFLQIVHCDNMSCLRYLTRNAIDRYGSDLLHHVDRAKLLTILDLDAETAASASAGSPGSSSDDDDEGNFINEMVISKIRWKEFGMARKHAIWNDDFLPCELFSPEGFWAWNVKLRSQTYKNSSVGKVWADFELDKRGWVMSPPVLLPSSQHGYKVTLNLRIRPEEEDDGLSLQMVLVNDNYNKKIMKAFDAEQMQLKLPCVQYRFIDYHNGEQVGAPVRVLCPVLKHLHDSIIIPVPGCVICLSRPPIICIDISST